MTASDLWLLIGLLLAAWTLAVAFLAYALGKMSGFEQGLRIKTPPQVITTTTHYPGEWRWTTFYPSETTDAMTVHKDAQPLESKDT